jgi:hypothetical protein
VVSARGKAALGLALASALLLACNAIIGLHAGEAGCGNGELDPGEECDDGPDAGPTCVDCQVHCIVDGAFTDPLTHRCYALVPDGGTLSWTGGLAACQALGYGYAMAGVSSPEEVAFLAPHLSTDHTWVGGTDITGVDDAGAVQIGPYRWVDGEPWWPEFPWETGEPNDVGMNEHCVAAQQVSSPTATVQFLDADCASTYPVLCER